ncbi:MAG: Uncharacterized protein K0S32_3223 [Bacteroidetes bacterium]|jgi:hypothetical protein|nr:Uncharacterized protein [Bacteroidota bacterium]
MSVSEIQKLREITGKNKVIPSQYELPVLMALAAYPELRDVHVEFLPVSKLSVPYATVPEKSSLFKSPDKRKYIVQLLEEAKEPEFSALFKNLPLDAQIAVIGHELVHVLQYHRCNVPQLLKFMFLYTFPKFKKEIERSADIEAIRHGLGEKLHVHALYLRSIPKYIKKRPELNKHYLRPGEILIYLNALKMQRNS